MRTLQQLTEWFELWDRYHSEYTEEQKKDMYFEMCMNSLPPNEKNSFINLCIASRGHFYDKLYPVETYLGAGI